MSDTLPENPADAEGWNMFDAIEQIVGRRVTHTDQLTADEQSTVYAALKEMQKT